MGLISRVSSRTYSFLDTKSLGKSKNSIKMADTEVVDWAADVEAEEREKNKQTSAPAKDIRPELPQIPKTFDIETYEEPEPVIVHKGNNMYTKYSWRIVCDPKADPNDEDPAMVIEEVVENIRKETQKVHRMVAKRRKFAKYGMSELDGDGPNSGTTNMQQEDCHIMFLNKRAINKQEEDKPVLSQEQEEELQKMKTQIIQQLTLHNLTGKSIGEASYTDRLQAAGGDAAKNGGAASFMNRVRANVGTDAAAGNDDRPRVGQNRPGDRGQRMDDEGCTVRVTNLNETVTEGDIQDLFGSVGRIRRTYLARDKRTGRAKGFAYVTYESRMDAQKAIKGLNKYTFDFLVLNVELSQRNNN